MNNRRLSLPRSEWSPDDQAALERALSPGLRRHGGGRAARWRPATLLNVVASVGNYLGFLVIAGSCPGMASLPILVTETGVLDWIAAMNDRHLMGNTLRFRVTGLLHGCRVMYPLENWQWLREIVRDLPDGRAESRRRKQKQLRDSPELFKLGIDIVAAAEKHPCRLIDKTLGKRVQVSLWKSKRNNYS